MGGRRGEGRGRDGGEERGGKGKGWGGGEGRDGGEGRGRDGGEERGGNIWCEGMVTSGSLLNPQVHIPT